MDSKAVLGDIDLTNEEDFGTLLESYDKKTEEEELIEGTIVKIDSDWVLVDVGMKIEGKISPDEIKDENGELLFKEGDKISVLLVGDRQEKPRISYKKARKKLKAKEYIQENKDKEDIDVTGVITKKNAGGYIVDVDGVDMFLPTSLAAFKPKTNQVGKTITARVTKMDEQDGSIVLSRRFFLNSSRRKRKETIKKITENGGVYTGLIKSIKSYGIFVEIDGVEGLVHYTEISYKGPVNPSSVFKIGQKVEVTPLEYDKERKRLSLSIKAVNPNPWETIANELEVGDTVKVYITNMEKYGVFVDLGNEIEGFLHISEISWDKNVTHPSDVLKLEQEIDVEVIELAPKEQRLRVSLKKLMPKPFDEFVKKHKIGDTIKTVVGSVKDFGCFLNAQGIDGLLHNEEVSWDKTVNAKDVYKVGDALEAMILKLDTAKERISFSVKRLQESPIEAYAKEHKIGSIVSGQILDIKDFGVFVQLTPTIDGLIRTEDLGNKKQEELQKGETIESVLISVDKDKNKIRLSARKLAKKQEREILDKINQDDEQGNDAFKDAFNALNKGE